MSIYTVSGRFQSRDGDQPFTKDVEAENEDLARERIYTTVGSQHNRKRTQIEIEEVSEA
ncbi:50S ribosomal protein L18a [Halorubrum sp. Atlit-8R]|uniref:50S ribosomal protein L18Ae n=1 Tax=unclassified Halorubrum TaxID=2642239 RepID=UPI000EF1B55A|nr:MULTISPECIES: 50S ribosomal protein L18Ae [unclassified Halorubrum]RLM63611.1 50S ribosomal protein L18a [Halorubrum sp. Atlit-9R]RLM77086.1 50S ribosomal protein L18a [Halorubrum sp. Atlit-8R]